MTIRGFLLFLLLLWPDLASSSRSSAEVHLGLKRSTNFSKREFTQGYPSFFSTHSATPWSRTRGLWRRRGAGGSAVMRTIHVSRNESSIEVKDKEVGAYEGADLEGWSCPDSFTLLESIRYLLRNDSSDYFSCTLEKLSDTLKLSPAVAGVTLLAVGNGAPDVFSSVAAFMSSDKAGGIGLSCVLGGALFITTVVSGAVALVTDRESNKACLPKINLVCFVRDALFLLVSSAILAFILLDGKVYLWEAAMLLSIYATYAISVWAAEVLENRVKDMSSVEVEDPLLPKVMIESSLPQSIHMQQHLYHLQSREFEAELESFEKDVKIRPVVARIEHSLVLMYKYGIERPLALPRQLTIPVIEEERWSRSFAVASCTLAPLFGLWLSSTQRMQSRHPRVIFSINPAILGLTVLAWGNCIGDLVADLALACGGRDGVQIAVSGCYAGPLFNMVVGLGLSLLLACWRSDPNPLVITDEDGTLFFIIGFLIAAIVWALIVLPLNDMRLSKGFGAGLLLLYCGFLVTGMCYAMGWISR
ncbi:hypothetical protein GOP47_0010740 [Adiantum capillus-veneris]|uniref:Sodium/calcium exchanger membrane region domain-containing protein n=1 Tax=Adiantum capillus-veneris TaxID=13818 RepID=A0A9D4UVH7_ADICA|nr:hypothetical protein GOP47_0010740 [Adiantum capillus-veneris]